MDKKVDLTLLKKFVYELETSLSCAKAIQDSKGDVTDWIIELSKSGGIAAGAMQEAGMLVADIQNLILSVQGGVAQPKNQDLLNKILGKIEKTPFDRDKN